MAKIANKEIYVADFETSHEERDGKHYAWVWLAGYQRLFTNRADSLHIQGNINDFVCSLLQNETKKVYFHNLKFDGQFLLFYFLMHGYKYNELLNDKKQMSYIISEQGAFYKLSVTFVNNAGKLRRCHFIDSFKIYPYSLKVLAKQLNLPVQKGELDHDTVRYPNHTPTEKELEYFKADIAILKLGMEVAYEKGFKKLTIGSNALEKYKETLKIDGKNPKYIFKDLFTPLTKEQDKYLRPFYKGGCCMVRKDRANLILPCYSFDINSLYPAMMYNKPMPFGRPHMFEGKWVEKEGWVCCQRLKARFFLKEGFLPSIQLKHTRIFQDNEWIENSPQQMELFLTNIDLDTFFRHYDVLDIEWLGGMEFRAKVGFFRQYLDECMFEKENSKDEGTRLFAKLKANNIYGKFGTNPDRKSIRYELKDGMIVRSGVVDSECDTIYLPIAIFTTSYARHYLLECGQKNYDTFIYCDTDSLHLTEFAKDIPLDDKKMGYFKHEYTGLAKHIKQKTYIVKIGDEFKITCAGMNKDLLQNEKVELNFETFKLGAMFPKLRAKRAIGGVFLEHTMHTVK